MAKDTPVTPESILLTIVLEAEALRLKWVHAVDAAEKKGDMKKLCTLWLEFGEQYDKIDETRKQLLQVWERLDKEILPKFFEDAGIDKVAIPELGRSFYPLDKYSAKISNKDQAFAWLRESGQGEIITETVNAQTLAAFLRARLVEEGLDPPESMTLTKYQIMGSSKYKPKS